MILRGLLDQSLGGFTCIRGYAPMGDLARVSYADMSYQRDLMKEQSETIMGCLRNKQDLFFPEVVLSCPLEYDFTKTRADSSVAPMDDATSKRGFRSNVNGISVTVRAQTYKTGQAARSLASIRIATLNVPDDLMRNSVVTDLLAEELESLPRGPLFRIDGNHRLSAADLKQEFRNIIAPFCILLFPAGAAERRSSKTIFYNINSKSVPLTPEQIYRIVLDDVSLLPDATLRDSPSFGDELLLARKALAGLRLDRVYALDAVLRHRRTAFVDLFGVLKKHGVAVAADGDLKDLYGALDRVHDLYRTDDELRKNTCVGLFHAFVFYALTDKHRSRFKPFRLWVSSNHLNSRP